MHSPYLILSSTYFCMNTYSKDKQGGRVSQDLKTCWSLNFLRINGILGFSFELDLDLVHSFQNLRRNYKPGWFDHPIPPISVNLQLGLGDLQAQKTPDLIPDNSHSWHYVVLNYLLNCISHIAVVIEHSWGPNLSLQLSVYVRLLRTGLIHRPI